MNEYKYIDFSNIDLTGTNFTNIVGNRNTTIKDKSLKKVMFKKNFDITFLTDEQIFGDDQLDIIKKYGTKCAITDFSILLGVDVSVYYTSEGNSRKDRTGWWWTKSSDGDNDARIVCRDGDSDWFHVFRRSGGARPAIPYSSISGVASNGVRGKNGILEVEYGEYPQTVVREDFARTLERAYSNRTINQTGKSYTTDSVKYEDTDTAFKPRTHIEYEYNGRKYIRFVGDSNCSGQVLSDGRTIQNGDVYWLEVEPIKWMIDKRTNIALSKKIIFSGVQFYRERNYKGDFNRTDIKKFMDEYFSKDIIPSMINVVTKHNETSLNNIITGEKPNQKNDFDEVNIIERLLDKIDEIANIFKGEFKEKVDSRLNEIIAEYKSALLVDKKLYDDYLTNSKERNDKVDTYNKARETLEKSLNELVLDLTKYKDFYDVSIEISQNKALISNEHVKKLEEKHRKGEMLELPKETNTIKDILTTISVYLSKINEAKRNEFITRIDEILSKPKEKFLELTDKELNDEFSLIVNGNPKSTTILELTNILDEIKIVYTKNQNYYSFYNALAGQIEEENLTNGITNFIGVIRKVINELDYEDDSFKDLKEKFNLIFERYRIILDTKFESREELTTQTFNDLEEKIRTDLHPLLEELDIKSKRFVNGAEIRNSLKVVKKVIDEDKTDTKEEDSTIILYTKKLLDEINNSSLTFDQKKKLKEEVKEFAKNHEHQLNSLITKEEFDKYKIELNIVFSRLFTNMCERIYTLEKFGEHIEVNQEVLDLLESRISK